MPRYSTSYTRYSSASPSTTGLRESAITWSNAGGHNHDGESTTLLDFEKYTIFDFGVSPIFTDNNRSSVQDRNLASFEDYILDIVSRNTITPQDIIIGNETYINGENISVRTITTNQLSTDSIKSLNYSYTSGNYSNAGSFFNLADGEIITPSMYLDSSGNLYLSSSITIGSTTGSDIESGAASGSSALQPGEAAGDVNSNATTINGGKIRTGEIQSTGFSWNGTNTYSATGTRFDLDDGQIIGEQFRIFSDGSASFAGDISGASGTFTGDLSGADITGGTITIGSGNTIFKVNSSGDMWIGNATETSAPFRVVNTGAVTASNLTVTGGSLTIGSANNIFKVASDGDMWLGHATQSSAPFQVTKAGALTASSANITGTVNATSGSVGSFTISATKLSSEGTYPNNYLEILNYGDLYIYSKPTSGGHSGQTWRTYAVGEWLQVERTDAGSQHFARLGNWWAGNGVALGLGYAGDEHAIMSVINDYGTLELRDTSNNIKISLSGQYGDATFARDVTISDDLTVSDDCTVGGNFYASINNTNAIRTRVNTSGGEGVIRTGAGNANYTPITINTEHGGLFGSYYMISFYHYDVNKGTIYHNGTNTIYGTSSDHRLKENIETITDGLDKVNRMKPRYYKFIDNHEAGLQSGFIAHELQEIAPEVVMGVKDAVDEDGNPVLQQIEKAGIVAYLVAAIQELSTEIEDLKAQIASFSN